MEPATASPEPKPQRYLFDDLTLDVGQRRLWRGEESIRLSKLTFALLRLLVESAPNLVTHAECAEKAWGPRRVVTPENLSQRITMLRQALGDNSAQPRYIESIRGDGYRLVPKVRAVSTGGTLPSNRRVPRFPARKLGYVLTGLMGLALGLMVIERFAWQSQPLRAPTIAPLTFDGGLKDNPRLSPDGTMVAFDWDRRDLDNQDIYVKVIGPDTRAIRVTDHPAPDVGAVWSPDGRQLAFLRIVAGRASIYTVPSLGGQEKWVVDVEGPARFANRLIPSLSWSPNGRFLVYGEKVSEEAPARVVRLDLDTLDKIDLTTPPGGEDVIGDFEPRFSPDGSRIAFVRAPSIWANLDIWVVDVEGHEAQRITAGEWLHLHNLVWAANGRELLFTAGDLFVRRAFAAGLDDGTPRPLLGLGENDRSPSLVGNRLVFARVADAGNRIWQATGRLARDREALARDLGLVGANLAFAPNGDQIAWQSNRTGIPQIWVADRDGANARPATAQKTGAFYPDWSPDGLRIVFESYESGSADIYALEVRSGRVDSVTTHPADERNPTFSRDGQWIYFSSNRSGEYQIYKKPANGGEEAIRVTSGGGFHGVESRDGQRLYYARQESDTSIWRIPVDGGKEVEVLAESLWDARSWDLAANGIYYESSLRGGPEFTIHYLDLTSGAISEIYREAAVPHFAGFWPTVSPDEEAVVFTKGRLAQSELFVVEDFR